MAFTRAIEPQYKEWVQGINKNTIMAKISELNKEFTSIIHNILYTDNPNKKINKNIDSVRKRLLYIQLATNQLGDQSKTAQSALSKLSDSMELINKYEARETQKGQKKSLDILTYVSIVILPLTLIASYFGMNFASMGAPARSHGILSMGWGQIFVFSIGVISIVVSILVLNHYYKIT